MLLHQAVRGFEFWFGVRPQVTPELRALVEADLGKGREPPREPAKPEKKRTGKRRKGAAP
jgi:hypothetical protein